MTVQFSLDDLLRVLGAATVDKGEFLWLDDRVRQVEVAADGTRISGNVFGWPDDHACLERPSRYHQRLLQLSGRSQLQACSGGAAPALGTPSQGQNLSREGNGS